MLFSEDRLQYTQLMTLRTSSLGEKWGRTRSEKVRSEEERLVRSEEERAVRSKGERMVRR